MFYLGVFLFGPPVLADYKDRMLGIISALLGGLFGYFLTGSIVTTTRGKAPGGMKMMVRATGGVAGAVALLMWWSYGPVRPPTSSQAAAKLQQQIQQTVASTESKLAPPQPVSATPTGVAAPTAQKPAEFHAVTLSPEVAKLAKDLAASDPKYKNVEVLQQHRPIPMETLTRLNVSLKQGIAKN